MEFGINKVKIQNSFVEIDHEYFFWCMSLKDVLIEEQNFKKSNIKRVFENLLSFIKIKIGSKIV